MVSWKWLRYVDRVSPPMVRGISKNYKEPVAYFYTDGLKFFELVEMIKTVGKSVLDAGKRFSLFEFNWKLKTSVSCKYFHCRDANLEKSSTKIV